MDLATLRVFKAVVDQRSFRRGAEATFITQPAASQAIRRLEDELGARLLHRGRPPSLTPAGQRVYEHATDVLARDQAARRDVDEIRKGGLGVLTLGASQALSREVLPRLVRRFHALHPLASFHLETLPSREIIRVVADGRLELGLGPFQRSMAGLSTFPLGRQSMVLYAGRGSAVLRELRRNGEEALHRVPLVTSHLDAPGTRPGGGQLRDHFRTVWVVESLDLRCELVKDGLAVGYLPESTIASRGLAQALSPVRGLDFAAIDRTVGLFASARRAMSEAARDFITMATSLKEPLAGRGRH